jgi:hypothetical protein
MVDIFEEVDEALQQERMAKLWREYGPWIIAGLVSIVLGTGLGVFIQDRMTANRAADTKQLIAGVDTYQQGDATTAIEDHLAPLSRDASADIDTLAALWAAHLADNPTRKYDFYHTVAEDLGDDPTLIAQARLQAALIALDMDSVTDDKIIRLIDPLLADNGPYQPVAQEIAALINPGQADLSEIDARRGSGQAERLRAYQLLGD